MWLFIIHNICTAVFHRHAAIFSNMNLHLSVLNPHSFINNTVSLNEVFILPGPVDNTAAAGLSGPVE